MYDTRLDLSQMKDLSDYIARRKGIAKDSETQEEMVIYRRLYENIFRCSYKITRFKQIML